MVVIMNKRLKDTEEGRYIAIPSNAASYSFSFSDGFGKRWGCHTPPFAEAIGKSLGLSVFIWLVGKSCSGVVAVKRMLEDGTYCTISIIFKSK